MQLSSKMTFSAKKLKQVKIYLLHCKKHFISLEEAFFMFLSFALKFAFINFFSLKQKSLSIRGLAISSFALNTELVFLEALKEVILCNKL